MPDENPSPPIPRLQALLLCERVELEDDGSLTLRRLMDRVLARPGEQRVVSVFFRIVNAIGDYTVRMRLSFPGLAPRNVPVAPLRADDPSLGYASGHVMQLGFAQSGTLHVELYANDILIGSTYLMVEIST